jgi:hypothetical protein
MQRLPKSCICEEFCLLGYNAVLKVNPPAFTLFLHGVFFDPEGAGGMFLRIFGYIPEDGTLHNHRCENLKS